MAWREGWSAIQRGEKIVSGVPEDETEAEFYHGLLVDRAEGLIHRDGKPHAEVTVFVALATGRATPLDTWEAAWLSEGGTKGALTERTKVEHRRALKQLAEWLRKERLPCNIENVDRRVAGRFVSECLIPSGRHARTNAKTVHTLSAYWKWLRRRGHVPDEGRNPWAEQTTSTRREGGPGADEERPFTDGEIARLLAGPPDQTLADFMVMAVLTGMRREELGRLTVAECADGVFVVQRGKTAAARRRVPIHSGLAALVARRCLGKSPDTYLFHELRSSNAERTDPIGKAFTRHRRRLGIQEGSGRRSLVNFHSFRRWFVTSAINAGQPPHVVSLVVGHSEGRKGMTLGRYWGGADDDALRECVEAVKLPVG